MIRDEQPAPIILTRPQVLALATRGEIEIRLSARARGPAALPDCTMDALLRRYAVGRRLWARESFATRRDGAQLKILYPWQGPGPQLRLLAAGQVQRKYLTQRYVTRPAKYMPRWAARILLPASLNTTRNQRSIRRRYARLRIENATLDKHYFIKTLSLRSYT